MADGTPVKLFIGGFPKKMNEIDLVKLIIPFGEVKTIKIVKDRVSKKSKGYAFVEVRSEADAARIIKELNGFQIGDKVLRIGSAALMNPVAAPVRYVKASTHRRPRIKN